MITLKIINNPFQPYDGVIKQVPYVPGESVFYYAQNALMLPDDQVAIICNARVLNQEEFHSTIPASGDFIAVMPNVTGGNNSSNKILSTIATIVLMAYAPGIGQWASKATGFANATTVATTWNFWGWAAYMGTVAAGGALINHWFPPPKPEKAPSPTYGWNGIQPLVGQNQPVPVIFGTIKMAGQVVSSYINYSGSQQYLNVLIEAGEGPCDYVENGEDANCTGISDIKINGNPITNYSNVQVYKRAGLNNQSIVPNFNDTRIEKSLSYQLDNNTTWYTDTIASAGDGIEVVFYWPSGLRNNDYDGDTHPMVEKIRIEYKPESASDWITWDEFEIEAKTAKAFWKTYRLDGLVRGVYNIRCKCTFMGIKTQTTTINYIRDQNDNDFYMVYWTALNAVIYDDFARPNKILLGIKALATDQLNGSPAITFNVTRSNVWVWNPDEGEYQQKPATNPAWTAYWILHRVYYLQNINTDVWEFVVRGVPASRLLYHEFERWADFCEERGLEVNIVFDAIQKLKEALADVEELGRGKVISRGTKYGCVFDEPAQKDLDGNIIPAQVFNMSNIVLDSFSEQFVDVSDRATAIEVTFFDRDNSYERTPILVPGEGVDDAQAQVNPTQITLKGCTSRAQAWKEGKYRLRLNNYLNCTGAWQADVDAIVSSLGQTIMIQHDVPAWGIGGRIVEATETTITLDKSILTDVDGNEYYEPEKSYQVLIRLFDDTMVYRNVLAVDETGIILALSTPFETVPELNDLWNFGEMNKVSKPFKIIDIKRSRDVKYNIAALEYIDEIYTEAEDVPDIEYSYLDPIFDVEDLTIVEETFSQEDGTLVSNLNCAWRCPVNKWADAYIVYISTDGMEWELYETILSPYTVIQGVKTGETYRVRVVVRRGVLHSAGVISNLITIIGKDTPPGDINSLTIIQQEGILKVSIVPPDDPDIAKYEFRVGGLSWETSAFVKQFKDVQTTIDVTQAGTQTFWVKAIDNSKNYSANAASTIVAVYAVSNKFTIHEEVQDGRNWTPSCMFHDKSGWQIDSIEKIGDLEFFSQIFDINYNLCEDAEIVLDAVDCGPTITPTNYIETFLSVFVNYDSSDKTILDIDYRTSWDGVNWSEWTQLINHQFNGRYVQPKLRPRSLDGVTNVNIRGCTVRIDVTAVMEQIDFINVAATGTTKVYLSHRFFNDPMPQLFSYTETGRQCMHDIGDGVIQDEDGRWYMDISLWDGGVQVAGKIGGSAKGY